ARINWFGRQECLPYNHRTSIFRILRIAQNRADITEHTRRMHAVPIYPHATAGGQTANVVEQSIRIGHVSPQKISDVSCRIRREIDLSAIAQRFYLRSYPKGMAVIRVVERLDPEWIARQKEPF